MYRYKYIAVWLCVTVSVLAQTGFSLPNPSIQWKSSVGDDYSPYNTQHYYYKTTLTLFIPANAEGAYFLGVGTQTDQDHRQVKNDTGSVLRYFITSQPNTNHYYRSWPQITSDSETYIISLSGKNNPTVVRVPLYIWIDPGQRVIPDMYTGTIPITLYKGAYTGAGVPETVATGKINFSVRVTNKVQLSLGNDQFQNVTELEVAFSELTEGQTLVYDAYINTTEPYKLALKSEHRGHLGHKKRGVPTKVAYTLYVDDQHIQWDAKGESQILLDAPIDKKTRQHIIKLVLGKAGHAFKGQYYDRISIKGLSQHN